MTLDKARELLLKQAEIAGGYTHTAPASSWREWGENTGSKRSTT